MGLSPILNLISEINAGAGRRIIVVATGESHHSNCCQFHVASAKAHGTADVRFGYFASSLSPAVTV